MNIQNLINFFIKNFPIKNVICMIPIFSSNITVNNLIDKYYLRIENHYEKGTKIINQYQVNRDYFKSYTFLGDSTKIAN